ncbi:kinetochore complex Sim4 subunit Fta1-domain-containing protein [Nemania sp. FL0916]|nr:kinetochore complex Sim4 subunit Fta1-domain-containing protein [Nemania sp. FL0916]
MPPRRGRPAAAAQPSEPQPEAPAFDNNDDSDQDQDDQSHHSEPEPEQEQDATPDFQFFNTTFSTFRVSPLYVGQHALTPTGLETLSRRLRDTLVGDVVRGVHVGAIEGGVALDRLGALERVEWRLCGLGGIFPALVGGDGSGSESDIETDAERGDRDEGSRRRRRGGGRKIEKRGERGRGERVKRKRPRRLLCLELEYERATFSALLLPSLGEPAGQGEAEEEERGDHSSGLRDLPSWTRNRDDGDEDEDEDDPRNRDKDRDEDAADAFRHFPLLLTRMPAALKSVLISFLSTTFDCRVSTLHLGTRTLVRSWERWIADTDTNTGRKAVNKDVVLTLGLHLEPPQPNKPGNTPVSAIDASPVQQLGLKAIDVVVPADEVRRFLRVGKKHPLETAEVNRENGNGNGKATTKRPLDSAERDQDRIRRRKLGGGKDEEGWWWRETSSPDPPPPLSHQHQNHHPSHTQLHTTLDHRASPSFPQPFTDALASYLSHHLGLDMLHPSVRVLRVSCDAFALSEGRLKVFASASRDGADAADAAAEGLLRDLVKGAEGAGWSGEARRLAGLQAFAA